MWLCLLLQIYYVFVKINIWCVFTLVFAHVSATLRMFANLEKTLLLGNPPSLGVFKPSLGVFIKPSLGVFKPSLGVFKPSLGVFIIPSLGVFKPSLGVFIRSQGVFIPSLGVFKPSPGVFKPSPGVFNPSLGVFKPSLGVFIRNSWRSLLIGSQHEYSGLYL